MIDVRLRSRIADAALSELVGKAPGPADFDCLLTGPAFVRKPDGKPLCVYLPGAMKAHSQDDDLYKILNSLKTHVTRNRGNASGTKRIQSAKGEGVRSYAAPVASMVVGAVDPMGQQRYCRLTAWTGRNLPDWERMQPALQAVDGHLRQWVPDRYARQAERAQASHKEWIVPGTAFSTITVNNSYSTGMHKDAGDLAEGFSTIFAVRRGEYTGGVLTFPAFRVGVDLRDGDLILMDAHEYHGNTPMVCSCGNRCMGPCVECGAERISVVSYFREKVTDCGSPEEEAAKGAARAEARNGPLE